MLKYKKCSEKINCYFCLQKNKTVVGSFLVERMYLGETGVRVFKQGNLLSHVEHFLSKAL